MIRTFLTLALAASMTSSPPESRLVPGQFPIPGAFSPAASITFVIERVRDEVGHVRVDICTPATFLKSGCPYSGEAIAAKGVTTVVIPDLPPGTYAAQIYHDRNDNHRVDRNSLGLPVEEIGFSQDAAVGLRGPSFAKAAFVHGLTTQTLSVRLHRYDQLDCCAGARP